MDRLLYGTPTVGHPQTDYVLSVRALELTCNSFKREMRDFRFTGGPVQMARSRLARTAIDDGYDYLLMHDDDLVVSPMDGNPIDHWHALMRAKPGVGVIGAVYLREKPVMPNVAIPHPRYPEELCHTIRGFPDKPFEVGAVATGFMLIRVDCLRAIMAMEYESGNPPIFRFPMTETRWGTIAETGEDYDFCNRARKAGWKVVADPRWKTVHIKESGRLTFDRDEWERDWTENEAARVSELQKECTPAMRLENVNGFTVLDHVPQRELDAREWRQRTAA